MQISSPVTVHTQLHRFTHGFTAPSSQTRLRKGFPPRLDLPGAARGPGRVRVRDGVTGSKEFTMKKITVRKAGTVRLTSAASACYCGGGPVLA
jgi:hypothetical protein